MIMLFIHTLSNRTHTLDCTARLRHDNATKTTDDEQDWNWNRMDDTCMMQTDTSVFSGSNVKFNIYGNLDSFNFSIPISSWLCQRGMKYSLSTESSQDGVVPSIVVDFLLQFGKIDKAMAEDALFFFFLLMWQVGVGF